MTIKSPLLSRPAAVEAGGADAGVAAHYGEPLREQRALAAGTAVVDLSHRGVVTVSGPDRLSWLNTLSSQQLTSLAPGQSTELLLLSVQGRIEFDARVVDDGATTWLIVEAAEAAPLAEWLNKMKFMLRVEIADVSADWAVLGSTQPRPGVGRRCRSGKTRGRTSAPAATPTPWWARTPIPAWNGRGSSTWSPRPSWSRPWATVPSPAPWPPRRCGLPRGGPGGARKRTTRPSRTSSTSSAPPCTWPRAATRARRRSPASTTWATRRAVSCSSSSTAPSTPCPRAGSEVRAGERKVGTVTSVAQHYEMGPVALAVIKRSVAPDEVLTVVDGDEPYTAAQEVIVAPDAGQVVGRQTGFLRGTR